jgi:hypothetical protein
MGPRLAMSTQQSLGARFSGLCAYLAAAGTSQMDPNSN